MIYYVEDDADIRDLALYALATQDLEACGFGDGASFKRAFQSKPADLVLLDIMLPGEDGLSILSWVRTSSCAQDVPIMMLTAKGAEYDKVVGLDAGADDYLAKPFGMMELVSRCKALLRRSALPRFACAGEASNGANDDIVLGPLVLSSRNHQAFCGSGQLELTLKEFELLKKLISNPGQVFSRSQLLKDIWDISFAGETRTVDTHIQTLRRKLNDASFGTGDLVETVRGVGYRIRKDMP